MALPLLGEVSMKRAEGELIRGRNGNSAYELLPQAASKQGQPRLLACVLRGNADIISAIADDWRSLCSGGPCDQPFFRPEWVNAYLRAFAPAGTLLLITIREEGRLRAVLPLLEEKSRFLGVPFSRIRSAAHPDYSCRFDIIRDGGRGEDEVLAEIWKCLRALPNWDVIELANIPAGGAAERLLELARAERYRVWQRQVALSPYIVLTPPARDSDFTRFVRSANLRSKLRRRRRKLQELGPVLLRRVDHADDVRLEEVEPVQHHLPFLRCQMQPRMVDAPDEVERALGDVLLPGAQFGEPVLARLVLDRDHAPGLQIRRGRGR